MSISLSRFRADFTDAALDFVVDQWRRLGGTVSPGGQAEIVVDPEALVALTTSLGRRDSRVFDGMIDWLACNGQWMNVQRLARIAAEDGFADQAALGAVAAWLSAREKSSKWRTLAATLKPPGQTPAAPLFVRAAGGIRTGRHRDEVFASYGLVRTPLVIRKQSQPIRLRTSAALLCTSRAAFGVAIRADVMAFLVVNPRAHARGLASMLGYNHMQVRAVLLALEQAGIATAYSSGRTRAYAIDMNTWRGVLLGPNQVAEWMNWRSLARGLNAIVSGLWAIDGGRADATVAESLVHDAVQAGRDDMLAAHPALTDSSRLPGLLGTSLAKQVAAIWSHNRVSRTR